MSHSLNSPVPTLTTEPSIYSPQPVYHPNVRSPSLHSQTLSDFETTSKEPSLLGPPLTRDPSSVASNSTAGYLPTPIDDVLHVPPPLARDETTLTSYYRNQVLPEKFRRDQTRKSRSPHGLGASQVHQQPLNILTPSPIRVRADLVERSASIENLTSTVGGTNKARDPGPLMPLRMKRERAARDLISRYENIDLAARTPPASYGSQDVTARPTSQLSRRESSLPPIPPTIASPLRNQGGVNADRQSVPHSHCLPESPSYFSSFAQKRGKLRNSFTNLVQLLGDKAKSGTKKRNSVSPSVTPGRMFNALPKGFKLRLSKRASIESSPTSFPAKDGEGVRASKLLPNINELLKTEAIISALLLYQSPARQTHPSIPDQKSPFWMPYMVSLYPSTIVLQIPNPGLSSSSKFQIPLSELYDVHSIAAKDLLPGSPGLLGSMSLPPGFGGDIYVFETQCYGGRIERFAAPTMALRTTWVRHLLDVLVDGSTSSKNKDSESREVQGYIASALGTVSTPSLAGVRCPPLVASTRPTTTSSELAQTIPLVGDNNASVAPFDSAPSIEERPASTLMRSSTPSKTFGRAPEYRTDSICVTSQTVSVLPNPWDSPVTPTQPACAMAGRTSSPLMSPRSDRSRMTASPSISRLDERSLVRSRLAMFERNNNPSPSGRGSVRGRGGKEGSVNWEVLSEVRTGRSGSVLSWTTSSLRGQEIKPTSATEHTSWISSSPTKFYDNNQRITGPRWPFPESTTRVNPIVSNGPSASSNGSIFNYTALLDESTFPHSSSELGAKSRRGLLNGAVPSLSLPIDTSMDPKVEPVQVLGNLPPSSQTKAGPLQLSSGSAKEATHDPYSKAILDRLAALVSSLRESDAAHSTKASGLGQLITSTQDHIIHTVEDGTKRTTTEYLTLLGRIESLGRTVESLVSRPTLGSEERANLVAVRESTERIDRSFFARLENLSEVCEKEIMREMETLVTGQTDALKQIIQGLVSRANHESAHSEVSAKLDALTLAVAPTDSSTRDVDLLKQFVEQIKEHVSSLPTPNLDLPATDACKIMEKLDLLSSSTAGSIVTGDLSEIQATLETIKTFVQLRDNLDTSPTSVSTQVDMSDLSMKLDGITAMCQSIIAARVNPEDSSDNPVDVAQQTLLAALKEDAEHRTVQAQQTTELIRYSNELNLWLEKFVTNASMQMDSVGNGLSALRRDLGLDPPSKEGQEGFNELPQGAMQELRTMIEEQAKSGRDIAASLQALIVAFNEEQARNAQASKSLATDAVLKTIEVQQQEQERLLKQLASDLSSDIRGERIRFVEAMSQATSMNIHLHVEEFKKQLTHEVLALTDEVGRLREERKTIQHQIAQLFLIKSEHEAESRTSEPPPPRPLPSTRPDARR
ncbi:hypothetical protein RSOLAG1IB_08837 [Rhizoctonia solani AG-1 IB]|uniref:PH domain-containing protein n=1 Tax=Thanatephorus cucumeris (strain AG1-IB / isolate 7/3/14) TaxID=1108050 RepID=A0A0B7FRF1_THACB|nr:hypothetical protein RSOLAG1IB_08837 [Rhizoctonia solani AG-1 IB]